MSPSAEYFRWRHYHPHEAEDPSAVWAAAWNAGGRSAMHDSARLIELAPLLSDLLFLLEDGVVESAVRASDQRPAYVDDDESDCEVTW